MKTNKVSVFKINIIQIISSKARQLTKFLIAITCIIPYMAFATLDNSSTTESSLSVGATIDDQSLAHKVNQVLNAQVPDGSFTVASYGKEVLLAGQVPSSSDKIKAETAVTNTSGVTKMWSYLTVGFNEDSKAIAHDAYLTSAAKTRLIAQKGVNTNNIKVVTSNNVVYLLGRKAGKSYQIKAAVAGIKEIDGVDNVVNLIGQ